MWHKKGQDGQNVEENLRIKKQLKVRRLGQLDNAAKKGAFRIHHFV